MAECIIYKGKRELDAIAAWSTDHADTLDLLRRIFIPAQKTESGSFRTTFGDELAMLETGLEVPDLLRNRDPDAQWEDAKTYMAELVCYVWNNFAQYGSNEKAADYVFRIAREGSRYYADCKYARTLIKKYGKQESTIRKEARILHASQTHFKKDKWRGIEKPPTMAQMVRESKREEERQKRQEKKNARR